MTQIEKDSEFTLTASGDSYITLRFAVHKEKRFLDMIKILRDSDVAFTNLEMLIHDFEGYPAALISRSTCARAPPIIADDLKWAGINMVGCANNHSMDYSYGGMFATIKNLDRVGIVHAGLGCNLGEARSPAYLDTDKARVALISAASTFPDWGRAGDARREIQGRPGLNPLRFDTKYVVDAQNFKNLRELGEKLGIVRQSSESEILLLRHKFTKGDEISIYTTPNKLDLEGNLRSIRDARRMADVVIVSLHAHEQDPKGKSEYGRGVVAAQFVREFAKSCIDAGADAFLGHGPHILRGIEIYKGKPIFYSLGNFIFQNQTVEKLPQEEYENSGLDHSATPADFYDLREYGGRLRGEYRGDKRIFESVIPEIKFNVKPLPIQNHPSRPSSEVTQIKLYPITLQGEKQRSKRGRPILADEENSHRIINYLKELSTSFGTEIEFKEGIGVINV